MENLSNMCVYVSMARGPGGHHIHTTNLSEELIGYI